MTKSASESNPAPSGQKWTIRIILILMLGGVVVGVGYMLRNKYEATDPRPPYITKIERDLEGVSQTGETVRLSTMKGKVYLAALFSAQSAGTSDPLPALVQTIARDFASRPDFGVVAFSATPEVDQPPAMDDFLKRHGLADAPWLFLTAEPETMNRYVKRYFRLYPVMPGDHSATSGPKHDTRVVIVDRKANIRGYYRLLDPAKGEAYTEALRQHLAYVLDNP